MKPAVALLLALFALLAPARPGQAQEMLRIAAVVNDEVISLLDVNSRIRLTLLTLNQPPTPENFRQLFPQVLRTLIDERLQLQEIKAKGIDINETEVDQVLADLEGANRMPKGQLLPFLEAQGISKDTMLQQIRARVGWQRAVARRLSMTFRVTGDQIDEAIAQMQATQNQPQFLVAEIFLSVDNPGNEAEVKRNADRLFQEAKAGAPFPVLARQFSESSSAATGGEMGWMQLTQLDPEVAGVVERMQIGEISPPVRTISGFHILFLRERRIGNASAPAPSADVQLALRRIIVPAQRKPQLIQASQTIKTCEDVPRVAAEVGAQGSTDLGKLKLTDLSPRLQSVVGELPIGQASAPIDFENNSIVMVVCERTGPGAAPAAPQQPDREAVAQRLLAEKLDGESRKYLRDLRQSAYIDIRA